MKSPLRKRILRELRAEFGKYLVVLILMISTIGLCPDFSWQTSVCFRPTMRFLRSTILKTGISGSKKELIRQYMALPIIVTLIGAIVGNILGYTVMKNVCASMYYGSYSLYTNGEIGKLYIWSTTIVVIICLLLSLPIEKAIMGVVFREMMLSSVSGWIALWIDPKIYLKMFLIGIGTYAVVSLLEYRRIRRIPMDEALKNAE